MARNTGKTNKTNLKNKRLKHNDKKIIRPFSHQYQPDKARRFVGGEVTQGLNS